MNSMLINWLTDFFLINIFLLIFVLSWCKVTFVRDIGRHITIPYYKRLATYIIVLTPSFLNSQRKIYHCLIGSSFVDC